jgi:hypothetical protein
MIVASRPSRALRGARCKSPACANGLAFDMLDHPPGDGYKMVPSNPFVLAIAAFVQRPINFAFVIDAVTTLRGTQVMVWLDLSF